MEFLKKYQPKHYKNYISRVDDYLSRYTKDYSGIDSWVKSLAKKDVVSLNKSMRYLLRNNKVYFEESAILMTMIIRLFMIELDVDGNSIKLSNKELKKLVWRFDRVIREELEYRMSIKGNRKNKNSYTLLKD